MCLLLGQYLTVIKAFSDSHFEPHNYLMKNKYIMWLFFFGMSENPGPGRGSDLQRLRFRAHFEALECLTPSPAISEPQNISLSYLLEFFLSWYPKLSALLQRSVNSGGRVRIWGEFSQVDVLIWIFFYGSLSFEMFLVRKLSDSDNREFVSKRWSDQK